MKKKLAAALAVASLSALALAGCAPGGAATQSEGGTTGEVPTDFTGQFTYWGWQSVETMTNEIAAFNEVYPNITVNYKQLGNATYQQELTPGLLSDSGPDVFMLGAGPAAATNAPYVRDLTALAQQSLGDDWQSKISQVAIDAYTVDGALTAGPTGMGGNGTWMVNKTLFDELGIPLPDSSMTMADLTALCQELKTHDVGCLSIGAQGGSMAANMLPTFAENIEPGQWEQAVNGEIPWTDPVLVQSLQMLGDMFTDGTFQAGAISVPVYPDTWKEFLEKKYAMTVLGLWSINAYKQSVMTMTFGDNSLPEDGAEGFTTVLMPIPDLAGTGTPAQLPTGAGGGDAISKNAQNLEAAEAWVAWKDFSEDGQQMVADGLINAPALIGVSAHVDDYVDEAVQEPALESLYAEAAASHLSAVIPCSEVATALNDAASSLAVGTPAEQVAETLQAASAAVDRDTCS